MMVTGAAQTEPGKYIHPSGLVIVEEYGLLSPMPTRAAEGVESMVAIGYHDSRGSLVQAKVDRIPPGRPWFDVHAHSDMDEIFMHQSGGEVTFTVQVPGGKEEEIILYSNGILFFPAGVRHGARNDGQHVAYVAIVGIRAGIRASQDAEKGKNIPAA